MQKTVSTEMRGLISFTVSSLLSFACLVVFFYLLGSPAATARPIAIATIWILALVAHEIGHLFVLNIHNVPSYAVISPVYSYSTPLAKVEYRLRHLSSAKKANVALAGPLANLSLLIILPAGLYAADLHNYIPITLIANGVVALMSVIPVFGDGKQLTETLFGPHTEDLDPLFATFGLFAVIALSDLIASPLRPGTITFRVGIIAAVLFGFTFWLVGGNTKEGFQRLAISKPKKRRLFALYCLVLLFALVAIGASLRLLELP